MSLLDGWIARLLSDQAEPRVPIAALPILESARNASTVDLVASKESDVLLAGWPSPPLGDRASSRRPILLGGGGIALEHGRRSRRPQRRTARLGRSRGVNWAKAGQPHGRRRPAGLGRPRRRARFAARLGTRDRVEEHGRRRWFESSRNDRRGTSPGAGSDFLFFAADADFQVATFEDRFAYPDSTTRYRETMILSGTARQRYAVSIVEVRGGSQHDQIYHAALGVRGRWKTTARTEEGPESLLPLTIRFLPDARAEAGRWFAQALGEFQDLDQARIQAATSAWLEGTDGPSIRLHFLNDFPATLYLGESPRDRFGAASETSRRASLVLRRRSTDGAGLVSRFVTVFEPLVVGSPVLKRLERIPSPAGTIALVVETTAGIEILAVNLSPGVSRGLSAPDGGSIATDGLAIRLSSTGAVLAGGTFLDVSGRRVASRAPVSGTITGVLRASDGSSRGCFEVDRAIGSAADLAGRLFFIRHGDGATHSWTIDRVEDGGNGRARLFVREEPGFLLDAKNRRSGLLSISRRSTDRTASVPNRRDRAKSWKISRAAVRDRFRFSKSEKGKKNSTNS